MQTSGRVEYMFVNVGEEIEVKLTAQHLRMLPSIDNRCSNDDEHSAVQCEERCYWQWSTEQAKCRGSWMPDVKLPLCNNYEQMRKLISGYRKWVKELWMSFLVFDIFHFMDNFKWICSISVCRPSINPFAIAMNRAIPLYIRLILWAVENFWINMCHRHKFICITQPRW